jgi:DNA primase
VAFGDDDIRQVREATDIVMLISERVVLKQRGRDFWGCCPFHNEKTPSFKVDPVSQFYHCFGCGEGGDVFKFLMRMDGIDFPDAVLSLARRANIELFEDKGTHAHGRKVRLLAVCAETASFYHLQLKRMRSDFAAAARSYLAGRSLGGDVPAMWQLGFAPGSNMLSRHLLQKGFMRDELVEANVAVYSEGGPREPRDRFYNRIIFPISDLQGRPIAFGGRVIGAGEPKYLNSSDTPLFRKRNNLYAIDRARAQITSGGFAVVVEGYTDVIAMHRAGFANAVATLGTALTPEHLKLLVRFTTRVVLLFDGDKAGLRAADRASDLIATMAPAEGGRRADLFVAVLPKAMDPADFCEQEGTEAMRAVLDAAVPLLRFSLDRRLARWDLTQPEQRARALDDVVSLLVPVKGTLIAADYLNYLADVFGTEYQVVASALGRARPLPVPRTTAGTGIGGAAGAGDAGASVGAAPAGVGAGADAGVGADAAAQAAQAAGMGGGGGTAAAPAEMPDRAVALERELLLLYIEQPEVRERLREAFGRIVWSDARHGSIAEALLGSSPEDSPDALFSLLAVRIPDVADVLSGARLSEFTGASPSRTAGMLMFNIREGQLKRSILAENARLRQLADGPERDALFQHIAEMQRDLTELRKRYRVE